MTLNPLITIFIPVYNGEKYLIETLNSIKNQTYNNLEILLVDDTSTDNSFKLINDFANLDKRFKVFQKQNGGMTAPSWNFIIPKIKGDFVFYSSQDDLFSSDLIEKMVKRQQETGAETILPDMEFYFEKNISNNKIIGLNGNRKIILTGKDACAASLKWNIHGFMLNDILLIKNQKFPEDAFDSDEFVTRKIFSESNSVAFSEGTFFYRQDNENAITKTFSIKNFFSLNTVSNLCTFLKQNHFSEQEISETKFELYRRFLKYDSLQLFFKFKDDSEKIKVKNYLKSFKKNELRAENLIKNIKFAKGTLKIKYLMLYSIFKYVFLYKIALKIESSRIRSEFF